MWKWNMLQLMQGNTKRVVVKAGYHITIVQQVTLSRVHGNISMWKHTVIESTMGCKVTRMTSVHIFTYNQIDIWFKHILSVTKILEVNLFSFAHRLFHEDFSPINGELLLLESHRALHHLWVQNKSELY